MAYSVSTSIFAVFDQEFEMSNRRMFDLGEVSFREFCAVLILLAAGCGTAGGDGEGGGEGSEFDSAAGEQLDRVGTSGGIFTIRDVRDASILSGRIASGVECSDRQSSPTAGPPTLFVRLDGTEAGSYRVASSLYGPGEDVAVVTLVGIDGDANSSFTYPAVSGSVELESDVSGPNTTASVAIDAEFPEGLLGSGVCSGPGSRPDGGMQSDANCECKRYETGEIYRCAPEGGAGQCCITPDRIGETFSYRESVSLSGCNSRSMADAGG